MNDLEYSSSSSSSGFTWDGFTVQSLPQEHIDRIHKLYGRESYKNAEAKDISLSNLRSAHDYNAPIAPLLFSNSDPLFHKDHKDRILKLINDFQVSKTICPITVDVTREDMPVIVDGDHRARAAILMGASVIPSVQIKRSDIPQPRDILGSDITDAETTCNCSAWTCIDGPTPHNCPNFTNWVINGVTPYNSDNCTIYIVPSAPYDVTIYSDPAHTNQIAYGHMTNPGTNNFSGSISGSVSISYSMIYTSFAIRCEIEYASSSSSGDYISSSSISTSSSSSEGYSSESSSLVETIPLVPPINQNNQNLIPFSFIGEGGYIGNTTEIGFIIEAANSEYMNTQEVIDRDNITLTLANTNATSTVYVPQEEGSQYKHQSSFYVDVISNDAIQEVRTHTEPNAYEFEEPDCVFIIPKFTWTFGNTTTTQTTTLIGYDGKFWITTKDGVLRRVSYNTQTATPDFSNSFSSIVDRVVFATNNSTMYVSTNNTLYSYSVDDYLTGSEKGLITAADNSNKYLISLYDNASLWSVEAYKGRVVKMNPDTLAVTKIYTGIDAPIKIVKSQFHNAYFVAGTHILWKIDDGSSTLTAVYEVDDYSIADFDVSENGKICLLLHGENDDIMRVLDDNLYSFLLDERVTNAAVKFCKYCGAGNFYILVEISSSGTTYSIDNYIFNVNDETLNRTASQCGKLTTATTTTTTAITSTIEIQSPTANEQIAAGSKYDIKWLSSKAIGDSVKIELYKGGYLASTITNSTGNTGIYGWNVPSGLILDDDYTIKITWLANNSDPSNSDTTSPFQVVLTVATEAVVTTVAYSEGAVGIDYNSFANQIVIMLGSGLFAIYDMGSGNTYGLLDSGVSYASSVSIKNAEVINSRIKQTKVRIFVGSELNFSDRWDSGEITTDLTSAYYGGGNNLVNGKKYYVNIQTYTDDLGWSDVQTKEFIMPK